MEVVKRNYEAMFLISQQVAATFGEAIQHIREIVEGPGGTILAMKKWDERRLAYEIDKQKRGVYLLVYFEAPTGALITMENACNLSEQILRAMFVRADHLTLEEIQANDERQALEDEARLRASNPEGGDSPATVPAGADDDGSENDDSGNDDED